MWLVFLFITLGLTADDYFCPSLAVICETLGISQNIAGVTFLAFGNGAPDIFSALAAYSQSKNQTGVQLGMQALFGAGIFVTTVVVGVISFISTEIKLTSRPFIRDVLFYLGAMSWTFITLYKENITMEEAIGFIAFYVVYIAVVIIGRYVYQRCKRTAVRVEIQPDPEIESSGQFFETHNVAWTRKQLNASQQSRTDLSISTREFDVHCRNKSTSLSNSMVSGALISSEKTLIAPAFQNAPALVRQHSANSDEDLPLLGGERKVTAWRKFIIGLEPIDCEDWSRSNIFKKLFLICKAPAVFFLNLTIPVVDYDEEDHNWNKWLNVLHCITMPVFGVLATKAGSHLIGGKFPAWALALCAGLLLALVVAMTTKSEKRPRGHSLFAYLAFVISVVWIYTTANEIVNLLKTFGIVFGLSDALLGLTFLAWGNSLGDLISNTAMARQGFGRMAVSACFGGPLLNMLLGIGISCTYVTVSHGHAILLRHKYNQYVISAAFLAASLGSSAICIPLMGFRVPRIYGVYLLTLYLAYLVVSITTAIEHK
ncbi:mitochondrial sodium/calcium exchanger protein-like isoform X1 [Stylophora pistillata]|uniref:mitochondrial sodium/calcium exchanger protein-like isoform X1 n=1 Tax=Stylophora pistillata TaxID=50429 RepID=UPI000C0406A2|nr:mitochondrial sodium/calcium exchanger protein-like isoform X1 [Stylophora pistillata]